MSHTAERALEALSTRVCNLSVPERARNRTASRAAVACVVTLLSVLALVAPASSAAPGPVQASIAPQATLVEEGAAVLVSVTVSCAGGSDVLEAFVYITQDAQQSPFTPIPVRCGGRARTYTVRVPAPEGTVFHAGTASASGYVLVEKNGNVTSASPSQTLTIA
jgi:hypothetical protein